MQTKIVPLDNANDRISLNSGPTPTPPLPLVFQSSCVCVKLSKLGRASERGSIRLKSTLSNPEGEAPPRGAEHQLLRHLLLGEIDEVLPAAMRREDMLEIELLQLGHNLVQIVVGRRGQMETDRGVARQQGITRTWPSRPYAMILRSRVTTGTPR